MPDPFIFTRLYVPRPIETVAVTNLFARLMASDVARPLAFEVRARDDGVEYILGCTRTSIYALKHLLSGAVPGIGFGGVARAPVASAGRVDAHQQGLPTGAPDAEQLTASLYTALAARKTGETLALQIVLGRAHAPHPVRADTQDPLQPIGSRLWHGIRAASPEVRRSLQQHAGEARLDVVVRIGVDGPDPKRRLHLARGLFGSLQSLEAIGVSLSLTREKTSGVEQARPAPPSLQLTASELTPLLGWPLGEAELPGADPLHPRRLPVPTPVPREDCVFAVGTAPGPERPIGITAEARLSHLSVLGPTGAGKTEAVLVPLLLSDVGANRPVCFVDPKGQGVDYVLDCLTPTEGERVVLFDTSDPIGTAGFNPLDARGRDPYAVADSIIAVFKSVFAGGWGPRTEDILHAAVLTLAVDGQTRPSPHTLLDIPRLLTDPAFRRIVTPAVADEPDIARFWSRFDSLRPAQQESEIAAPMNKLRRYLMRRGVTAIVGQADPEFRLRDLWKSDRIVLVSANEALGGTETATLIGGLICSELFMAAQARAAERNPKQRPGFMYVDEVRKFLRLPVSLESALEISRSYGVGWALFGQGFYQMGTELADAVEINTASKVVYATSAREAKRIASASPLLSAEDIQTLPRYEIYAAVLTKEGPSGWFSARTRVPPERVGQGDAIRRSHHDRTAAATTTDAAPTPTTTQVDGTVDNSRPEAAPHVKRRRA